MLVVELDVMMEDVVEKIVIFVVLLVGRSLC